MTISTIQTSSVAGELSPSILGRVDKAQFRAGALTMRNMFVRYQGGAYSRAGFAYVGMQKQAAPNPGGTATNNPPRIINFQYNINQGFCLEFGDQYMRICSNGGYVTEATKNVTAITQANPGVITIAAHGYSNGDWIFASGIGGMTAFNGLTWIVQNATTNTFTLTDLFGNTVNTTSYPAFTSGGTFARIYTVVSPYAAADLAYLKFTQTANTMNFACWNQQTDTEYPPYNLVRSSNTNWVFTQVAFVAAISPPTSVSATANPNTNSTTYTTTYSYVVTAVDINGNESIASTAAYVVNYDIAIYAGSNTITWNTVANAVQYNVYASAPVYTGASAIAPAVGVPYGLIGTALGLTLVDNNIIPDYTTSPPQHANPFARSTISDVRVTSSGSGLSPTTTQYIVNTSTGSGFQGQPIVQNGNLTGFIINYGGTGFANTDTMSIVTGGVAASGTYTFTSNPTNGQTIILNGVTWTFETSPTGAAQTKIGGTLAATLTQLASDLASSLNNSIAVANYSVSTTVLTITYGSLGTSGNSYTLAAGTYGGAVSGATLTGGSNGTSAGATVALTIGPATGTYPGTVQYYQQRLVYADTINQPDTYFMSRPGLYSNFDSSIPTVDSDSITGTPWGQQVNGLQFLVPSIQGLLAFMGNGVWVINGGNSTAITPSDQNAQAQSQIGCSAIVPPLYVGLHVLYVQAKNSIVRDIAFNFLYNVFQGDDITVFSNHLFLGYTLTQWAYAEEPYKVVWAIRDDGVLLSLTYVFEQQIRGWARHDTNGLFNSVCSVIEPPVDAIYVSVQRHIAGPGVWAYYLERADNRQWNSAEECFCVDAGLTSTMTYPNATLTPAALNGTNNITSTYLINGGKNYTAPTFTAVDSTGAGTGATFTYTLSGGVITAVIPVLNGQQYTAGQTTIYVTDTTGSGAVVQPVITNNVTFNASASVFNSGMVGQVLRVDGGKATIVSQTGTACVANVTQALTESIPNDPNNLPAPAAAGDWSVAPLLTTVTGLNHLNGMTVSILADGGVVAQQVVTNNSITLPVAASYVTIGLPFTAQWQSMYLDIQTQTTAQGKRKNISSVIARVEASRGFTIGSNQPDASTQPNNANVAWSGMSEVKQRNAQMTAGSNIPLFTGDTDPIYLDTAWGETEGKVALQTVNPLPLNLLAVIPQFNMGDKDG